MKYLRLLFILNCFLNYLWSQDLPLDFENNQDLFTAFGNCEFYIQQDPTNNSNMVGVIQNSGSNLYEGVYLDLIPAANFDSSNIIRFDFFSDNGQNNTIQVKFEDSDSGFGDAFLEATIPGNGWSNVELDFSQSNIIGESGTENINGNFSRIAIALLVSAMEVLLGFRGLPCWLRQISRKSCLESTRPFLKRRSAAALG